MKSLNDFADQQPKSYKTRVTAQRALDNGLRISANDGLDSPLTGTPAIVERTDGRFAVIIINPDSISMNYFVHACGFGVHGVSV